jgi:hypothetical protein
MLVACADENNFPYQIGIFTLALTVMALTKMTEWASILMPLIRACMDPEVVYAIRTQIKIMSGHLHNVLAEAICGYSFV